MYLIHKEDPVNRSDHTGCAGSKHLLHLYVTNKSYYYMYGYYVYCTLFSLTAIWMSFIVMNFSTTL